MVKYNIKKYPKGSFKGQKTDGKYMDGWLHSALKLYAKKISRDMTFLGIIFSSTLEVGTGKSVMATQIGEAWTEIINDMYGFDYEFKVDNIVWQPKDLIEKSFDVPKYSMILLDEWEDSTYWSELGMSLRQFFRKCRQLNLFMIAIIPNWFQLPLSYAVSRSIFAIDVRFNDKLDRGFFSFYNFPDKRFLYIMGKRTHNYKCAKPTFVGRFQDGYGVDEEEYRKKKYDDMLEYDRKNPIKKTKAQILRGRNIEIMKKIIEKNPKISSKELSELLEVSMASIQAWKRGDVDESEGNNINYTMLLNKNKEIIVDEDKLKDVEQQRSDKEMPRLDKNDKEK